MKIQVNGQEIFELSPTQKKVIMNDINEDIFDSDMKRRLEYILMHKYEKCLERLKLEWMPKLQERLSMIPTDPDALAELIFSQPEYKSKKAKEIESAR